MEVIYWVSDGAGNGLGTVPEVLDHWILAQADVSLIVNGGDVYPSGTDADFDTYYGQISCNTELRCQTPGNHCWKTTTTSPETGQIAAGYERFWSRFPPPASRQVIATDRKGGARYEHLIDMGGWRLVFLDTALSIYADWPIGDESRRLWLRRAMRDVPGRAKIVFAHVGRLSQGLHGDCLGVDPAWRELFDDDGTPLAACMISGHDHNVSVYSPRSRDHPDQAGTALADGIHVICNGAGGSGLYMPVVGTPPDLLSDADHYWVTRIVLESRDTARFEFFDFGATPDLATRPTLALDLAVVL